MLHATFGATRPCAVITTHILFVYPNSKSPFKRLSVTIDTPTGLQFYLKNNKQVFHLMFHVIELVRIFSLQMSKNHRASIMMKAINSPSGIPSHVPQLDEALIFIKCHLFMV